MVKASARTTAKLRGDANHVYMFGQVGLAVTPIIIQKKNRGMRIHKTSQDACNGGRCSSKKGVLPRLERGASRTFT